MSEQPYHYKIPRKRPAQIRQPVKRKPVVAVEPETPLTGTVQGKQARKDEERFYNALMKEKQVTGAKFRMILGAPTGLPGQLELDFLVSTFSGFRAFELDDMTFVHRGAAKDAEMRIKDARRVDLLTAKGYAVRQVEHVDAALLDTQAHAEATVKRLLGR